MLSFSGRSKVIQRARPRCCCLDIPHDLLLPALGTTARQPQDAFRLDIKVRRIIRHRPETPPVSMFWRPGYVASGSNSLTGIDNADPVVARGRLVP
jgi:hypothetical protein